MAGSVADPGSDTHADDPALPMKALDLLEPGRLFSGALFRDLLASVDDVPTAGARVGVFRIVRELVYARGTPHLRSAAGQINSEPGHDCVCCGNPRRRQRLRGLAYGW